MGGLLWPLGSIAAAQINYGEGFCLEPRVISGMYWQLSWPSFGKREMWYQNVTAALNMGTTDWLGLRGSFEGVSSMDIYCDCLLAKRNKDRVESNSWAVFSEQWQSYFPICSTLCSGPCCLCIGKYFADPVYGFFAGSTRWYSGFSVTYGSSCWPWNIWSMSACSETSGDTKMCFPFLYGYNFSQDMCRPTWIMTAFFAFSSFLKV